MGDKEHSKESYETVEPTSYETQVDKRIHPLARSQPVGPQGTLGATASSKMQNTTAEEDPEVLAHINDYYSPGHHIRCESIIRAFIRETLNEAACEPTNNIDDDTDELDEFAALAGGAVAGFIGPLSGHKQRVGSGAVKEQTQ